MALARFQIEASIDHEFKYVKDTKTGALLEDSAGRQKLFHSAHVETVAQKLNRSELAMRTNVISVVNLVKDYRVVGYDVHCEGFYVRVWIG